MCMGKSTKRGWESCGHGEEDGGAFETKTDSECV
jgi:hypothetical protein